MAWSSEPPFYGHTRAVLGGADDGGLHHHVFVVVIAGQKVEHAFENTAHTPAARALVDGLGIAEAFWRIRPGNAGPIAINNRFDKKAVVLRGASDMAFAATQEILDPLPLVVA